MHSKVTQNYVEDTETDGERERSKYSVHLPFVQSTRGEQQWLF